MECRYIRKKLSAYQDGELVPEDLARVKSHLQRCPECRARYAEFQQMWVALADAPEIHPAPTFYLDLRKKIAGLHDRRSFPRLRHALQFLPASLATVVLLVAGLFIGTYLGSFFVRENLISTQSYRARSYQADISLASIRTFDAIPPGTLAHGYMRLTSYTEGEY